MPLTSITRDSASNCRSRAGISEMWATECDNVATLTFDSDYAVTAVGMDLAKPDPTFKKFEFEKNTAFFEQPKTSIQNASVNVAQTINFNFKKLNAQTSKALYQLNQNCCLHAIVRSNDGTLWYFGVSYFPEQDTYVSEDLAAAEGSANSGTDPAADVSQYVESLTCNANWYAWEFSAGVGAIPV